MNSGPQNPCIERPPDLSGPEVSSAGPRPPKARVASGKSSFLASLGFHGCLLVAACSVTFMNSSEEGSAGDKPAGDPAGFEMKSAARQPVSEETVSSASSLPQPAVPVMVVNSAAVQLPPVEPMALVTANTNKTTIAAPTPAATEKSSTSGDHGAAKSTGRKGAGRGETAKRDSPVPPPKLVSAPPPAYPAAAKAARKSGKVGVLVRVRGNGSAAATSVYHSSGNSQLDQAAVDAARSWKFSATPSLGTGETVAVVVLVTFKP